jgi:hypothetical protein
LFFNETCGKEIHQSNQEGKGSCDRSLQTTTQPKTHKTSTQITQKGKCGWLSVSLRVVAQNGHDAVLDPTELACHTISYFIIGSEIPSSTTHLLWSISLTQIQEANL